MASNRKVQRLLNEFMDLLSEYRSAETRFDKEILATRTASEPPIDQMASALLATEPLDSTPPETDKMGSTLATNEMDSTPLAIDKADSAQPPPTDQVNSDELDKQINLAPSAEDPIP